MGGLKMSTAPERTLPDYEPFAISPAIDAAISVALTAWYAFGASKGDEAEKANAKQAQYELRQSILAALITHWQAGHSVGLAALEPERALSERCDAAANDLMNLVDDLEQIWDYASAPLPPRSKAVMLRWIGNGFMRQQFTATSSTHEGME
jgi:hypothetical protein